MKKYMKPALAALSISANDVLCSGCGSGAVKGTGLENFLREYFDYSGDGRVDWNTDFPGLFNSPEDFCNDANTDERLYAYCKHTPENVILWS